MVRVKLITVGKIKENWIEEGVAHYKKLLKSYVDLDIVEIKEEKIIDPQSTKYVLEKEAGRISNSLEESGLGIVLDVRGDNMSSEGLAKFFEMCLNRGDNAFTFIIGGASGLSPKVINACPVRLSLSRMTFTHEMSRVILLEQIYRAFSIIRGSKYHK